MSESKHTPGPWMVMDGTYGFGTELGVCEVKTEYFVAGIVADIPELEDRARANANLIAAAPEMLEALHKIEQQLDYGQIDAARRLATDAIAKAEGRP